MTRRVALLVVAASALLLLGVGAAPWLLVPTSTAISSQVLRIPGSQAVPGVPAAAIVVLAAVLALALSGRIARLLAAGTITSAGVVVVAATGALVRGPEAAALAAVASTTGVRTTDAAVLLTPWPVVAGALGAGMCVAGVVVAVTCRRWTAGVSARRYVPAEVRPVAPNPASGSARDPAAGAGGGVRDRARDDWDALSRGEDPS